MATEIKVPTLGESVTEATVARWMKQAGDAVAADEPLVELETDKVTVEVPAPAAGVLGEIAVGGQRGRGRRAAGRRSVDGAGEAAAPAKPQRRAAASPADAAASPRRRRARRAR